MRRLGIVFLFAAGAIYAVTVLVWLSIDRRSLRDTTVEASVWDTSGNGSSLAHAYLRERGGDVRVLTERLSPGTAAAGSIVFRIRPLSKPFAPEWLEAETKKKDEKDKAKTKDISLLTRLEDEWVRDGGRLVLAIDDTYGSLKPIQAGVGTIEKVFPFGANVRQLEPAPVRILTGPPLDRAHSLFTIGGKPLIARIPSGRGDVILCATPEIFENAGLGRADHLALLEELSRGRKTVYFDEYSHGVVAESGVYALLVRQWRLGPALVLFALAGLAAWWRATSRVGPPERDPEESRSEAVDLVESLGSLYDRALTHKEALRLYYRSLVRATAEKTGLKGAALKARIRSLTGDLSFETDGRRDLTRTEMLERLEKINEGFRRLEHAESR